MMARPPPSLPCRRAPSISRTWISTRRPSPSVRKRVCWRPNPTPARLRCPATSISSTMSPIKRSRRSARFDLPAIPMARSSSRPCREGRESRPASRMRTNLLRLLFWGLTLTYAGTTGFSQVSGIIDQAETARQQREAEQLLRDITRRDATVAGLYPDEIGDVGPQSALRVRPRPVYFDVLADSQFYYTDNMLFQEPIQGRTVGASVLVNTAQLSFTPP